MHLVGEIWISQIWVTILGEQTGGFKQSLNIIPKIWMWVKMEDLGDHRC